MHKLPTETIKEILDGAPDETATDYCIDKFYWKLLGRGQVYVWSDTKKDWLPAGSLSITRNLNDMREILALREAMQEFVDRVDAGEARSKRTYTKFKLLLKGTNHE